MRQEKAKKLLPIIQAIAEGKQLQFSFNGITWFDESDKLELKTICDDVIENNCDYRIKQEENPIIEQNTRENQIEDDVVSLNVASKLTCYDCLRHRFCYLAEERENNPCNKISLSKESEEKHYRPFKYNGELINYCGTKNIWVKSKFDSNCILQITGYSVDSEGNSVVWLTDSWITLEKLFDAWLFLDDSFCGLEM